MNANRIRRPIRVGPNSQAFLHLPSVIGCARGLGGGSPLRLRQTPKGWWPTLIPGGDISTSLTGCLHLAAHRVLLLHNDNGRQSTSVELSWWVQSGKPRPQAPGGNEHQTLTSGIPQIASARNWERGGSRQCWLNSKVGHQMLVVDWQQPGGLGRGVPTHLWTQQLFWALVLCGNIWSPCCSSLSLCRHHQRWQTCLVSPVLAWPPAGLPDLVRQALRGNFLFGNAAHLWYLKQGHNSTIPAQVARHSQTSTWIQKTADLTEGKKRVSWAHSGTSGHQAKPVLRGDILLHRHARWAWKRCSWNYRMGNMLPGGLAARVCQKPQHCHLHPVLQSLVPHEFHCYGPAIPHPGTAPWPQGVKLSQSLGSNSPLWNHPSSPSSQKQFLFEFI